MKYDAHTVEAAVAGKTLCIVGGVHGNEVAGIEAIKAIRSEFRANASIARGCLKTIIANTLAVEEKARAIDLDLNRAFVDSNSTEYEAEYADDLAQELDGVDFVLDIHSTSSWSPVFAAGALTRKHIAFCASLGVETFTTGWSAPRNHGMLIDEADRRGAVGLLVECGQHHDPSTIKKAIECCMRAMIFVGMIEEPTVHEAVPTLLSVEKIVKAVNAPIVMARGFRNLERVPGGTVVCRYAGKPWIAYSDFSILIPAQDRVVPIGNDAFAVGRDISKPVS